jgi:lactoylglutathione lyase
VDDPVFRKVDSVQLPVPDLDAAFAFYTGLGHELIWRSDVAFGLRLPESDAELVCFSPQPGRDAPEVDITVTSVEVALQRFVSAGGAVMAGPFDIAIGRCAVVADPFGNKLVLLDNSSGTLATNGDGMVVGIEPIAD